jgi:hypothetical protein
MVVVIDANTFARGVQRSPEEGGGGGGAEVYYSVWDWGRGGVK